MSVARNCPYSDNEENCRYEIFTWVPRLNKCSNCERFLKKRFPNIDTSSYNIDENGNVLREVEGGMTDKEKEFQAAWYDYCITNRLIAYGEVPELTEEQIEARCMEQLKKDLEELRRKYDEEIAELDCQMNRNKACYSCANATERCFENEIGCPCEKYKSYKDENAELKEQNLILADCSTCHSTCKNENVEIKKQFTKARELLTKWVELFNPKGNSSIPPTPIQVETEQFLREVEE